MRLLAIIRIAAWRYFLQLRRCVECEGHTLVVHLLVLSKEDEAKLIMQRQPSATPEQLGDGDFSPFLLC